MCVDSFCCDCLQPCLQVTSPLCPLCRMPFDPKKVDKSSSVEKQLSSYKAPCRGCSKKVISRNPNTIYLSCFSDITTWYTNYSDSLMLNEMFKQKKSVPMWHIDVCWMALLKVEFRICSSGTRNFPFLFFVFVKYTCSLHW